MSACMGQGVTDLHRGPGRRRGGEQGMVPSRARMLMMEVWS